MRGSGARDERGPTRRWVCPPPDEAGWLERQHLGGHAVIRIVVVLGVGYVLGAKAGRRRYEQIAGTYKAVTGHPAAST